MRRLKTLRRPPIYPKTPGHLPCSSLTHPLPLSSRRPSVSFGGFGLTMSASYCCSSLEKQETRLLSGAGLRVVQSHRITCFFQVEPRPGVLVASPGQLLPSILRCGRGTVKGPFSNALRQALFVASQAPRNRQRVPLAQFLMSLPFPLVALPRSLFRILYCQRAATWRSL